MTEKDPFQEAAAISDHIIRVQAEEIAKLQHAIREAQKLLSSRHETGRHRALAVLNQALVPTPRPQPKAKTID